SQLLLAKPFIANCSLETARRGQEKLGLLMAHTHKGEVTCEDFTVGSVPCAMLTPKNELSTGVILYLHGGGYTAGSLTYAKGFATILAAKCGIRVMCAAYRLAPEHLFPTALEDSLDAYGYLLSGGYAPSQILLCGESAGGGLCYSLRQKLRDKGRTLPAGIIAVSPWTDLTAAGASYGVNAKKDPSMTAERLKYFADCYVYGALSEGKNRYPKSNPNAEEDHRIKQDPRMSPLFGSLEKMPPSLIFVGGDEIMLDDAVGIHQKMLEAGMHSELVIKPNMWHGYVLYCLKENESDFHQIAKFIKANVPHQKKLRWMSLDNAAKIFPAARRRNWNNVFRLSATLTEDVDRAALQIALDVTVRRFPSIAVRIKTGVFWYYLEEIPKPPEIMEEKPYPLSRMPFDDIRKCAFRVILYGRRIAVEFFHALTDGNGGLVFLKTLLAEYVYQKHGIKVTPGNGVLDRLEDPTPEELEDSFLKNAGPQKASRSDTNAFRIHGTRVEDGFKTNTTFLLQSPEVVAGAKQRGVTVTAYLTAALMMAAVRVQEKKVRHPRKYRPIKVLIPVNLRKMFNSKTLRNFVLYATTGIDPQLGEYSFDELCGIVHHQMQLQITKKNMAAMIATNVGDEKPFLLRVTPLFLKNAVMKLIFDAVGERKSCFSFSNLGVANLPPELCPYVDRFDFVLGVQASAPYNVSAITYNGRICLNVIRNIEEPLLEYEIYQVLRQLGIHPVAESNTRGKEI
ncbi:MAG: alpha/beta hydrolase fold domain-containing protein, partial [Clostridia bacterium]|nr:alpha/beta hydrolase fold domain-containing protein [Clostridia bacterium]